ncbi:hypothetical protein Salat_1135500 [Sesamum alatum]|uniref:Uncharacterized protein n=1 Tax=Sesamum alatum TaxID=300844 RepID=A0AAE2CNG4_9LAMI|nr:hypothetical protein Salat_1135500 [Sesamum alatum]
MLNLTKKAFGNGMIKTKMIIIVHSLMMKKKTWHNPLHCINSAATKYFKQMRRAQVKALEDSGVYMNYMMSQKRNNAKMFDDFKRAMAKEFEMTAIGLMSYYLGIENMWTHYDYFLSAVEMSWATPMSSINMAKLAEKLQCLEQQITLWNKDVFKNIFANIKQVKEVVVRELNENDADPLDEHLIEMNRCQPSSNIP